MRERKNHRVRRHAAVRGRETPAQSKSDFSQELMDLVVEAAKSRDLPVFLAGFASRATEMLKAEWGGVGEILGSKVEMYSQGREFPGGAEEREWVEQNVTRKRLGLEVLPLGETERFCALITQVPVGGTAMSAAGEDSATLSTPGCCSAAMIAERASVYPSRWLAASMAASAELAEATTTA